MGLFSFKTNVTNDDAKQEEAYYMASQWALTWRKFKKHKLAVGGVIIIAIFSLFILFAEFFAPLSPHKRFDKYPLAPPQRIRFFDEEGNFHLRPFIYGIKQKLDLEAFFRYYTIDKSKRYSLYFISRGTPYKLWNIFNANLHFFGTHDDEAPLFLFGTDKQARDLFSRIIYGTRISLSIGLLGVFMSFVLGIAIGGISGYFGGITDVVIQRIIEILRSFPRIPLWMALSAALPPEWPVMKMYFFITLILAIAGWTGLARVVRGKFFSLREEDFVIAARVAGASDTRVIFKHILPSFASHLIAAGTLAVPIMIIGETSLSFLGLGLRPPAISWGVLLQSAQNVQAMMSTLWLLLPAPFVIVAVLAFNFVGDGLRDAADPYR